MPHLRLQGRAASETLKVLVGAVLLPTLCGKSASGCAPPESCWGRSENPGPRSGAGDPQLERQAVVRNSTPGAPVRFGFSDGPHLEARPALGK